MHSLRELLSTPKPGQEPLLDLDLDSVSAAQRVWVEVRPCAHASIAEPRAARGRRLFAARARVRHRRWHLQRRSDDGAWPPRTNRQLAQLVEPCGYGADAAGMLGGVMLGSGMVGALVVGVVVSQWK
jgi:hypothetical protein